MPQLRKNEARFGGDTSGWANSEGDGRDQLDRVPVNQKRFRWRGELKVPCAPKKLAKSVEGRSAPFNDGATSDPNELRAVSKQDSYCSQIMGILRSDELIKAASDLVSRPRAGRGRKDESDGEKRRSEAVTLDHRFPPQGFVDDQCVCQHFPQPHPSRQNPTLS